MSPRRLDDRRKQRGETLSEGTRNKPSVSKETLRGRESGWQTCAQQPGRRMEGEEARRVVLVNNRQLFKHKRDAVR